MISRWNIQADGLCQMDIITETGFAFWALRDGGLGETSIELEPSRRIILAKVSYAIPLADACNIPANAMTLLVALHRLYSLAPWQCLCEAIYTLSL